MTDRALEIIKLLAANTGFYHLTIGQLFMILLGCIFCWLAIAKHYEPYELLPIGLGTILINLPLHQMGVFSDQIQSSGLLGIIFHYGIYFYNVLPPLIFLGLGAATDFGPIIANPRMLLLGGAAQIGIFVAFMGALWVGFDIREAASISIIGGADGPTTIYLNAILTPKLLAVTAVTAYSYIALIAIIQPPIIRILTTKEERGIRMVQLRHVSKRTRILFPIGIMVVSIMLIPMSAPLISMFTIGNVFRESGVVDRLTKSAQNELLNLVTIFLMLCIGITLKADVILQPMTLKILLLGLIAFICGTAGGIILAKIMNLFSKNKINPIIGAAGVSAVPMAARVAQEMAYREDPNNHLLMHAMGPNVAGVIGSAIVAGYFISIIK